MKPALILALLRQQSRNVRVKSGAALYCLLWRGAAVSLSLLLAGSRCASLWQFYSVTVGLGITLIPLAEFLSWLTWPYVQDRILRSRNKLMVILFLRDEYIEQRRLERAMTSPSSNGGGTGNEELQIQTRAFRAEILMDAYPSCRDLLKHARHRMNTPYDGRFDDSSHSETTITFTYTTGTRRSIRDPRSR